MKLKHKPNHQLWAIGGIVIHDYDHISRDSLMVVVDKKGDIFITKYLFPKKMWEIRHKNSSTIYEKIPEAIRKIYEGTFDCDIRKLHYPGRFPEMKIDPFNFVEDLKPFYEKGQSIIEDYQLGKK